MPSFFSVLFFCRMVRDAASDPFSPLPAWAAPFWVLRHWNWLRRMEADGWPLP